MFCSRFLVASLVATALISSQAIAAELQPQNNQVNLVVIKYNDHIQVECRPANKDTSSRGDWRVICNEMAAAQIRQLVAAGTIGSMSGPVFDLATSSVSVDQPLSKSIPLLPQHL